MQLRVPLTTKLVIMVFLSSCSVFDDPILNGKVDVSALQQDPYKSWYQEHYDAYAPSQLLEGTDSIKVEVFFGSWCEDSHEQVPRFVKIAEESALFFDLYGVDRDKKSSKGFERGKNIKRVPTFIVLKNGIEIGRIVETPTVSLEEDLDKIILNR